MDGVRIDQQDLCSTHEEADILITQHAVAASVLDKSVHVVCDDTDVFVLLVDYYNSKCRVKSVPVIMLSPVNNRAVVDIHGTAATHQDITDDLLAMHGLSGADTVAALHHIGKATALKVLKTGNYPLSQIGDDKADINSFIAQATHFVCAAYGKTVESCTSMTDCRVKLWRLKTARNGATSVKLCSLPPTSDAFRENVLRCHMQVAIWKSALEESPPKMDPIKYGWELDHQGILLPRPLPADATFAPADILQLIRCNCKASGCKTVVCSCSKLGCTIFCLCEAGEKCKNPLTQNRHEEESAEISEEVEEE